MSIMNNYSTTITVDQNNTSILSKNTISYEGQSVEITLAKKTVRLPFRKSESIK